MSAAPLRGIVALALVAAVALVPPLAAAGGEDPVREIELCTTPEDAPTTCPVCYKEGALRFVCDDPCEPGHVVPGFGVVRALVCYGPDGTPDECHDYYGTPCYCEWVAGLFQVCFPS